MENPAIRPANGFDTLAWLILTQPLREPVPALSLKVFLDGLKRPLFRMSSADCSSEF